MGSPITTPDFIPDEEPDFIPDEGSPSMAAPPGSPASPSSPAGPTGSTPTVPAGAAPAEAPVSSHAPLPSPESPVTTHTDPTAFEHAAQNISDTISDVGVGAGKGALSTAYGLARLSPAGLLVTSLEGMNAPGTDQTRALHERVRAALAPQGTAEKVGGMAEQMAEFAIPEAKIASIPGVLSRAAARASLGAGLQTAREGGEADKSAVAAGALNATGGAMGDVANRFGRFLMESRLRDLVKILKPKTSVEKAKGLALAQRVETEGIAPAGSNYAEMARAAEGKLDEARQGLSAAERTHAEDLVDAAPVIEDATARVPRTTTEGDIALPLAQGRSAANRANAALRDAKATVLANSPKIGGTEVPLRAALDERRRLDQLVRWSSIPERTEPIRASANAWRDTINSIPAIRDANLRKHEMVLVDKLLRRAFETVKREGSTTAEEAAAIGGGLAGRISLPAIRLANAVFRSPVYLSLSAAGKRAVGETLLNSDSLIRLMGTLPAAAVPEDDTTLADRLAEAQRAKSARQMKAIE